MPEDAFFYIAQKAIIEKDGKILVLHDPVEGLDFPGGKIQLGEVIDGDATSLTKSLKREVDEEVGFQIVVFNPVTVLCYEFPSNHKNVGKAVYIVAFRCKYISGELSLGDEHDSFKWVDKNTYQEVDDSSDFFDVLKKYFNKFL